MSIYNAKITNTRLGEEHGCFTIELFLEGEGWVCRYGGYCLDHWFAGVGEHESTDGYGAIIELMKTFDVESWEEVKGQYVRVEIEHWGEHITKIGHLIKDKWFSFEEYFREARNKHENSL